MNTTLSSSSDLAANGRGRGADGSIQEAGRGTTERRAEDRRREARRSEVGDEDNARRQIAPDPGPLYRACTKRRSPLRRLHHLEVGVIDLDGPGSKRSRNIGIARFDNADVHSCQRKRREEQREEQRDPREK
ncbi:hypothetical protein [Sorangium cellulosum]|uniref:hypothetical protein n=1 Tax=Sorangium cellulosum TaxID=56 RepID=UPI0012DB5BE4|nr:hypothetical protein [Sorangium cellulosum]